MAGQEKRVSCIQSTNGYCRRSIREIRRADRRFRSVHARLKVGLDRPFTWVAVVTVLSAACGGRSPSAPSPPLPDFQGQFTGGYVISSCTETGVFFSGFCVGSGWNAGSNFPLELSLVQNQTVVTGTITLSRGGGSPLRGAFQGLIQSSGHLTGTAALPLLLGTINRDITAWDSTIAGNSLDGGFILVHSASTETGTMTVSASLLQVTRR